MRTTDNEPNVRDEAEESSVLPGVTYPKDRFIVLSTRLGRMMKPLPKINPDDEKETVKYFVPDAWERGEEITIDDIWQDPSRKIDNLQRLLNIGAICRLDHPEARNAVEELKSRRAEEESARPDRGVTIS